MKIVRFYKCGKNAKNKEIGKRNVLNVDMTVKMPPGSFAVPPRAYAIIFAY